MIMTVNLIINENDLLKDSHDILKKNVSVLCEVMEKNGFEGSFDISTNRFTGVSKGIRKNYIDWNKFIIKGNGLDTWVEFDKFKLISEEPIKMSNRSS